MTADPPFLGKGVLVTGGSRGIGRAIALAFAREGADVAFSYHRAEDAATALAGEIGRLGRRAFPYRSDSGKREDVARLVETACEDLHRLDVVVANAGIGGTAGWTNLTSEDWHAVLDTNLLGMYWAVELAAPELRRHRGNAIMIASVAGLLADPWYLAYAASKAGAISVARSLAAKLAPDVRVNAIAPGWVRTDMTADGYQDLSFREPSERVHPRRRWGEPIDIANAALFLASDGARFITGQTLVVDGGFLTVWWQRGVEELTG